MTLHLTLKKKWFDLILSGEKTEEYRENKFYWQTRLEDKKFTHIKFRNGYSKTAPWFIIELKSITKGKRNPSWGAPATTCYILKLGAITAKNPPPLTNDQSTIDKPQVS